TTTENTPVTIAVTANDSDPDGDPIIIDSFGGGAAGSTITDGGNGQLVYLPPANFAGVDTFTYRVRDAIGAVSNLATVTVTITATGPATFVVTNTNDSGVGSLREAVLNANANPFDDQIAFDIPGTGVHTIALQSALFVNGPTTIDGLTQPGS